MLKSTVKLLNFCQFSDPICYLIKSRYILKLYSPECQIIHHSRGYSGEEFLTINIVPTLKTHGIYVLKNKPISCRIINLKSSNLFNR